MIGTGIDGHSPGEFLLTRVFQYKDFFWRELPEGDGPGVVFGPHGRRIFLVYGGKAEIMAITWMGKLTVRRKNFRKHFSAHPTLGDESCTLDGWTALAGTPYAAMAYCGSVFVVNTISLEVERSLVHEDNISAFVGDYSAASHLLALYYRNRQTKEDRIRFYSSDDWRMISESLLPRSSDSTLTPDGRYLALALDFPAPPGDRGVCGVELRELPGGAVAAQWDLGARAEKAYCPRHLHFLPHSNYLFANNPLRGGIVIWDARTGDLIREIKEERPLFTHKLEISSNGRWIASSLRDDPGDTPDAQQDFKIWDAATGEVVYETPKERWDGWPYNFSQASRLYLKFSPDSRYLLVLRYDDLSVFEISPGP